MTTRTGFTGRERGRKVEQALQIGGITIFTKAGAPVDGTSGTNANKSGKGSICIDTTNGKIYINGGTLASPTWKIVTSAA